MPIINCNNDQEPNISLASERNLLSEKSVKSSLDTIYIVGTGKI